MARVCRPLGVLIAVSLALWVLVAVPGRYLAGEWVVAYSGTAAALCLIPAAVTLAWANWSAQRSPESFLLIVLGGSGIRLFLVSAAALALRMSVPFYHEHTGFWAWLLGFYLATLVLEMTLVLSGRPSDHK